VKIGEEVEMKKLISFRTLSYHCDKAIYDWDMKRGHIRNCLISGKRCCKKNCHIWKRLKEAKDE